jgi:serine/threonine protein kinase
VQQVLKFARKHIRPFGVWFTEESVRKELQATEFLARGKNPHLVEILGCGQFHPPFPRDFYIDMELCGDSLEQYLNKLDGPAHLQFRQIDIWRVMHQITSGVEYIHSCNTVHRDVKPANSMILLF